MQTLTPLSSTRSTSISFFFCLLLIDAHRCPCRAIAYGSTATRCVFPRSSCVDLMNMYVVVTQGAKTDKNLRYLLQKVLKQSDVGSLGRIVLPKVRQTTPFMIYIISTPLGHANLKFLDRSAIVQACIHLQKFSKIKLALDLCFANT